MPKPKPKRGKPDAPIKMSSVDEADPRFKSISFDPRFARFPRRDKAKVKVDARFASMLDGSNDDFKVGASKDKRGRKHTKKKDDVSRLFRLDDDKESDKGGNQRGAGAVSSSSSDEDEPILNENERRALRMRGLASDESSSEPSDSDESDVDNELAEGVLDEDLERLVEDWGVGAYAANPNEAVPMLEDSTARLACMDMDWENVKAVDILAVLRSFVPEGGRIESVSVYPSDYGLERMEEEKLAGPKQIYKKKSSGGDNDGAEKGDEDNDDDDDDDDDESDGAVDESRLRYYERSKLRWYYAIVVCSNVRTAEAIYTECDGMEYMKTANVFDLRFVPEGQSFEDRKVRDAATELPDDYVAPVFQTKALQHTNVELTWDKVDGDRKKTLSRKLNADDLKDEDFKTYLASASEDEAEDDDMAPEEDQDAVRERYQRLLAAGGAADQRKGKRDWGAGAGGSDGEGGDAGDDNDGDEGKNGENGAFGCVADKDMELQVTFEQDLEALGEKLSTKAKEKKRGRGAETVWEAYERRRKEKREEAKRKGRVNYHSSDDDYEDDFDSDIEQEAQEPVSPKTTKGGKAVDPFDDPFFSSNDTFKDPATLDAAGKKKKKKRGWDEDGGGGEEDARKRQNRQAELEMLLMDDAVTGKRGKQSVDPTSNQTKKISKRERMKLAKLKKRAEREDGSDNEDLEAADREYLDMKDPRFQEVFDNPVFALDPTDPRYAKAGKGASKLATEAARRRSKTKSGSSKAIPTEPIGLSGSTVPAVPANPNRLAGANGKELKAMVANLKRKSAAAAGRKGGISGKRKF